MLGGKIVDFLMGYTNLSMNEWATEKTKNPPKGGVFVDFLESHIM